MVSVRFEQDCYAIGFKIDRPILFKKGVILDMELCEDSYTFGSKYNTRVPKKHYLFKFNDKEISVLKRAVTILQEKATNELTKESFVDCCVDVSVSPFKRTGGDS